MKKIGIIFILLAIFNVGNGQILTKADITPIAGEHLGFFYIDNPDATHEGSAGTSQTWDFGNLTHPADVNEIHRFLDPAATPHSVSGATIAMKYFQTYDSVATVAYSYYKDTVNGVFLLRDYGSTLLSDYSDPTFTFRLPLTYGDSVTDDECYSSTAFGTTYNYCGTVKLKFDGTGTIFLPTNAAGFGFFFPGVYRFREDHMDIRTSPHDTSYTTIYYWFRAGVHAPLLKYWVYTDPNGVSYKHVTQLNYSGTNTVPEVNNSPGNVIFPNPVNEQLTISSQNIISEVCITSVEGRLLAHFTNIHKALFSTDTRQWSSGMYLVRIIDDKQHSSIQKLIVQH